MVEATDADSAGSALTATATGLPAGLSLADGTTSRADLPGTRTWTLAGNVTAAPGTYTGSVTVTDGDGEAITKPLIVTVTPEDAVDDYLGDTLSSGKVLLRATAEGRRRRRAGRHRQGHGDVQGGREDALCSFAFPLPLVSCTVTLAKGRTQIHRRGGRVLHRLRAGHRPASRRPTTRRSTRSAS